jgi:hypothetical protein
MMAVSSGQDNLRTLRRRLVEAQRNFKDAMATRPRNSMQESQIAARAAVYVHAVGRYRVAMMATLED